MIDRKINRIDHAVVMEAGRGMRMRPIPNYSLIRSFKKSLSLKIELRSKQRVQIL